MENVKTTGAVFTPSFIVNLILDNIHYDNENILHKKIMEPSFGDGVFLLEIVSRFISIAKQYGETHIETLLNTYIYGIEKEEVFVSEAKQRLNELLKKEGLLPIPWTHLYHADTTDMYTHFVGMFDYVVGNPPYVRIHNLSESVREKMNEMMFMKGNTDLYMAFYEIGLAMLKENGILSFITPNSFLKNTSQANFREYLITHSLVNSIFDFKSSKVFENADTYTCICTLTNEEKKEMYYREYDGHVLQMERTFSYDYLRRHGMLFIDKKTEKLWNKITSCPIKLSNKWQIQNGVSTNLDSVYIGEAFLDKNKERRYEGCNTDEMQMVWFHGHQIESNMLHRCVKESKYDGKIKEYILYPYENGMIINENKMKEKFPKAYVYLRKNKEKLMKRKMDKNIPWYAFGRSQGIKLMEQEKVVFQHIVKNKITPYLLDADVVVYSGLFATGKDLEKLMQIYKSETFLKYCRIVGKPMSGGYVALSSKCLKNYGIENGMLEK